TERDLGALRIVDPAHPDDDVVAAGAPWFMALFGRDSLLTSWMAVPFAPSLAIGTLRTLARLQGRRDDPMTEEEPGKILHEVRLGMDHDLALGGSSVYFGSIDATPLFVVLVDRALRWGAPAGTIAPLLPAVDAALEWMTTHGDRDGDGFLEYQRRTDRGLVNQGWKDSYDSIAFPDGTFAVPPIALAEVQGYAYAAYRARAHLADVLEEGRGADEWRRRAADLQRTFDDAFWLPDRGWYALALDRDKRPVDALASNMGHCLWSGIVPPHRAPQVADALLSPEMFTGFGIRTLGSGSAAYNPVSYHNGSVWPHDTTLAVSGLARYGCTEQAERVLEALLRAARAFRGRLPELFCGFDAADKPVPVPYPTSCSPQAWAAAAPYELLRAALRLDACVPHGELHAAPVRVDGLPLGTTRATLVADETTVAVTDLPEGVRLRVDGASASCAAPGWDDPRCDDEEAAAR
ncbi:MAG: amylo-alpha-1,6-glucosidase, partial [Actinomycetales bacterium]|nr:amylo-alpha-1,6-glucosidase [Actinomycetales bacterium]